MRHQGKPVQIVIARPDESGGTQFTYQLRSISDDECLYESPPLNHANGATLAGVKMAINLGMVIHKVDIRR